MESFSFECVKWRPYCSKSIFWSVEFFFLICTGSITHTHFVQTAEPSRVAVRQPSPQRTSVAVISKYTDQSNPTTMEPVYGQFLSFYRQLTSKQSL